jgi:hypothetical protein
MMIVIVAKVSSIVRRTFIDVHTASSSSETAAAYESATASESATTSKSTISSAATASKSANSSSSEVVWWRRRHGHYWKWTGSPPIVFGFMLLIPPNVTDVSIVVRIRVANPGSTVDISFVNFPTLLHIVPIL